jgi:GST-like protein
MPHPYIIYGRPATGSVPIEAALLLIGVPHELKAPAHPENPGGLSAEAMHRINPMQQLPALVLSNGEVMTESAAILIHLADSHPEARLAPAPGDPRRPAFLRWMVFVSAQIYALVWARDDPMRLAVDEEHAKVILARTSERRAFCWRMMDAQVDRSRPLHPGRRALGARSLRRRGLALGPGAGAVLSGGAEDDGRGAAGRCGPAADGFLGEKVSAGGRVGRCGAHFVRLACGV